jgi:hypothetical protein
MGAPQKLMVYIGKKVRRDCGVGVHKRESNTDTMGC